MPLINPRLEFFLRQHAVHYHVIHHERDFTSAGTAVDTNTPVGQFAKSVVLAVDEGYALAVLPVHHAIDFLHLREALRARVVRLASEEEIRLLFPDCEVSAEPPFGNLFGLPVYLSRALLHDDQITFNAGTHADAVRLRLDDFVRLVEPTVLDFSAVR